MSERPSTVWRREARQERAAVAAGTLAPEMAYALNGRSADFVTAVDDALAAYEREVTGLAAPADDALWAAVERVVTAVNDADEEGVIDTIDREDLADFIDGVLDRAGVDVDGLTSRRGLERHELTDTWREW